MVSTTIIGYLFILTFNEYLSTVCQELGYGAKPPKSAYTMDAHLGGGEGFLLEAALVLSSLQWIGEVLNGQEEDREKGVPCKGNSQCKG